MEDEKKITGDSPSFSEEQNSRKPAKVIREEELPQSTAIVQVKEFSRPIVTVEQAQQGFREYQALINALVTEKDIVDIKGRKVAKKSGINKLARFFGVSVEIIKEKQETFNASGKVILVAKVWARAILPNGQFRVAGAAASSSEKTNWAHMYNDVFTLAETRAKKRAIEEVVGFGELGEVE